MHASTARFLPRLVLDPVVLAVVAASWALMLGLVVLDRSDLIAHDAILTESRLPIPLTILVFVSAWQLMTAAMMLPTSLPMLRAFAVAVRGQERPRLAMAAFVGGYFAIWTGFAVAALAGDATLHWLVDRWGWLAERPWLVSGGLLLGAGAFQFSPLKERCLAECRSPIEFLWRRYRRGVSGALRLGLDHGLFCVGCCWALMLVMFAIGVGNLALMAAFTGVMLIERASRFGRRLVPIVGIGLITWGALVVLRPGAAAAHAGASHASSSAADPWLAAAVVIATVAAVVAWRGRHHNRTPSSGGN